MSGVVAEKIYGFRFMVVGKKSDVYGIKDLQDNVVEWYSESDVFELAKKVKIMGVVLPNIIDLDWFKGFYAMWLMSNKSMEDFNEIYGIATDASGQFCWFQNSSSTPNIKFAEFIESCVTLKRSSFGDMISNGVKPYVMSAVLDNTDCSRLSNTYAIGMISADYWGRYNFSLFKNKNFNLIFGDGSNVEISGDEIVIEDNQKVTVTFDCRECTVTDICKWDNICYRFKVTNKLYLSEAAINKFILSKTRIWFDFVAPNYIYVNNLDDEMKYKLHELLTGVGADFSRSVIYDCNTGNSVKYNQIVGKRRL